MGVSTLVSALVTGLVIGGLGRLVAPGSGRTGCLLTLLIGIAAAVLGSVIGVAAGVGFWLTLALQVLVAAVLVSLVRV